MTLIPSRASQDAEPPSRATTRAAAEDYTEHHALARSIYAQGIIDFSLKNKFIVLLATLALVLGGVYAVRNIPLDAIPDLSDVQVIIYTEWPGQAPQIVQDQVTYPITTKMLSVPRSESRARLFLLRLLVSSM